MRTCPHQSCLARGFLATASDVKLAGRADVLLVHNQSMNGAVYQYDENLPTEYAFSQWAVQARLCTTIMHWSENLQCNVEREACCILKAHVFPV